MSAATAAETPVVEPPPAVWPSVAAASTSSFARPERSEGPAADAIEIKVDPYRIQADWARPQESTRFMALCIGMLGVAMLAPILANWFQSDAGGATMFASRWQVIQVFWGALLLAYAVFLDQVSDRAALWSVSVVLLGISCLHGVSAMGTWLDLGNGPISRWLQVPASLRTHVTLWSFIYTLFGAILSSLCGYQAYRWELADYSALAESGSGEVTSKR